MKDYKRGKVIRLNDNSEYLICDNVLMKNEEYFLLLNISGKMTDGYTEILMMKYDYPKSRFELLKDSNEVKDILSRMVDNS